MAGFIRIQVFFQLGSGSTRGGILCDSDSTTETQYGEVSLKKLENLESVEGVFEKQIGII